MEQNQNNKYKDNRYKDNRFKKPQKETSYSLIHTGIRTKDAPLSKLSTATRQVKKSVKIYFCLDKSLGTNGLVTALSHGLRLPSQKANVIK